MCDIEPGKLILGFSYADSAEHALVNSIKLKRNQKLNYDSSSCLVAAALQFVTLGSCSMSLSGFIVRTAKCRSAHPLQSAPVRTNRREF
jgi:hypothetical protein